MTDTQLLITREEVLEAGEGLPILDESSPTPCPSVTAPDQFQQEKVIAQKTITTRADVETGSPDSRPARGFMRVLRAAGTFVGKGLCRLGIHRGPWAYLEEDLCDQFRKCAICETYQLRIRHKRDWRFAGPSRCEQLRSCGRCDSSDGTRIRHNREWRYAGKSTCNQKRVCMRCNDSDKNRTRHQIWGDSYSDGPNSQAHRCIRCGVVESWSTAEYDYY